MTQPTSLRPTEIADMLRAAAAVLQAELNALPDRILGWHPEPEEWCIKQVYAWAHMGTTQKFYLE